MVTIQLLQKFYQNQSILKDLDNKIGNKKYQLLIGEYMVTGYLGSGTFGRVFKGVHIETDKKVAIKLVDIEKQMKTTRSAQIKQKYKRYLQTQQTFMRTCHSAFVVKLYQTYENNKCKIFVMEYCKNGSLERYLNQRDGLQQQQAIEILRQIILGLSELHLNRIIHRDLSPGNIFIHDGIFKIGDFGYGKQIDDDELSEATICGNKHTMAPQVKQGGLYGLKADIWSLGMIYFMMLYSNRQLNQRYSAAMSFIQNQEIFQFRTVSGAKISNISKKFLRQTLQQDINQRMNWQQTLQHEIFKVRFDRLSEIYLPGIKQVFQNLKGRKIARNRQKSIIMQQQEQLDQFDIDQQIDVNQLNQQYLQCRIAQFIYYDIINPIQNKNLLDLTKRFNLEFVFLLSSRSRENIILAKDTINKKYPQKIANYFLMQVKQLENFIYTKFIDFSQKLTKVQDKIIQIVTDKIVSIIHSNDYKQKQKFFTLFQRQSFTRDEQIAFTCTKYINKIIKQIEGNRRDGNKGNNRKEGDKVKKILRSYKEINEIKLQQLQGKRIQQKVSQLLQDEQ